MPVLPLSEYFIREAFVAAQAIGFGKRHPMLVAVKLPGNLAVADFLKIEIGDLKPRFSRSSLAVHLIAIPLDFVPVIDIFVAQ